MHIHHPEIAKEFDRATPEHAPGTLPQHVGDKLKVKSKLRKPKFKHGR